MAANRLEIYPGNQQRYDELLESNGKVRHHWQPLLEHLVAGGPESVRRGVELARRLVIENGVTYNVYADPQGKDRPWLLDPLPLLIDAEQWAVIERGVAQRARLLNALLSDFYGQQQTLATGVVPPQLLFSHPNYLWANQGARPPGDVWLHVFAVDLARGPDGRWWVLADRTQTPSGPGYALENRQIVARVFPRLIDELAVRPLQGFFNALSEHLLQLCEADEMPLVVVLTPGPFNETYFEHAYLARQLGLALVQGQDLTVRADMVYLKTLSGLRRVHAILRRLDDDYCDPLELRADSALGVPGLLAAARSGNVVLANGLGSGVLESAAWQGFLPGACTSLLGETLQLPSVASWWCGEAPALDFVIENLDRLVIKPVFPNQRFEPVFGRDLDREGREQMRERLRARPHAYVAQERVSLSQAPVCKTGAGLRLAPRALSLRLYAIATADGYRVMPGGLARIAAEGAMNIVSTQRGGGSKDVWVLGKEDARAGAAPVVVGRQIRHDDLPSQLVENLYWLGRYSERCEAKARLLRATLATRSDRTVWRAARELCEQMGVLGDEGDAAADLYDESLTFGLASDLGRLGWSATQSRSRMSAEHWRSITFMQRQFHEAGAAHADPGESLDRLLLSLTALSGFALDDMTQDNGWRLLMLGRRLERVQFLSEVFAALLASGRAPARGTLEWLLGVCSSSITYRTRYLAAPLLSGVLELVVLDEGNPRGLAFQCQALKQLLASLYEELGAPIEERLDASLAELRVVTLATANERGAEGAQMRQRIAASIRELGGAAAHFSDRLSQRHFSHVDSAVQTVTT
ncbi:MAG TPA: circularly permuted type 2 ATP-grasp protein [Steroidobacteraceae bacterium]|nr:circularly permuted type 2 ATP-grasp protein [Steroidobacteraceae bacterium]